MCLSPLRRWCLIILLQVHGIQLFEYFQDIDFGRVWKFAQSEPVQQGTFVKILQVTTTCILMPVKKGEISETGEAMSTKIDFHAFYINFYLHEFLKLILFFDPHGL